MIKLSKLIKQTAILLVIFVTLNIQNSFSQISSFYIYFMQNGKRINVVNGKVELKKAPFKLYAEYIEPVDLLVSASQKGDTYKDAKKGKLMFYIPAFQNSKKHDSFFSKKNGISVYDENYSIWKKGDTDGSKDLKSKKNNFIVYKNVEKIFNEKKNKTIELKNVKKKLYLVFIYAQKDKDGDFEEIQREIASVKWVKKYYKETKAYARKKKQEAKLKVKQAKRQLKRKQKLAKKEEKRLKKIEKHKNKKLKKNKKKKSKKKNKKRYEKKFKKNNKDENEIE